MRPKAPTLTHKALIINHLSLYPKKVEISGLMRLCNSELRTQNLELRTANPAIIRIMHKLLPGLILSAVCLLAQSTTSRVVGTVIDSSGAPVPQAAVKLINEGTQAAFNTETGAAGTDRKSTRLNSSHQIISYAVFCLKKKIYNDTV